MPIIIPKDIPAFRTLQKENIFVMSKVRAEAQDIRPIEIAILNLMPTKMVTETQLVRLLSNSPLQINITLLNTATYESKNIPKGYLERFYKTFDSVKDKHFDGMIITGAPVEKLNFEDVDYWGELKEIFDFAKRMVTSTVFICWGAQAALYYYYGIGKSELKDKLSGVFAQTRINGENEQLLKGVDDIFYMPHSRYTAIDEEKLAARGGLVRLAYGEETGTSIVRTKNGKFIFITGHLEYDRDTLKLEYERDVGKGLDIDAPKHYFSADGTINQKWRSSANLIFNNWLNYYVYQITPYLIENIEG